MKRMKLTSALFAAVFTLNASAAFVEWSSTIDPASDNFLIGSKKLADANGISLDNAILYYWLGTYGDSGVEAALANGTFDPANHNQIIYSWNYSALELGQTYRVLTDLVDHDKPYPNYIIFHFILVNLDGDYGVEGGSYDYMYSPMYLYVLKETNGNYAGVPRPLFLSMTSAFGVATAPEPTTGLLALVGGSLLLLRRRRRG